LTRFYPFVRRRYRELLAAGRSQNSEWLFSWPSASSDPARMARMEMPAGGPSRDPKDASGPRIYAPDFSAYVIRSAKILRQMAEELGMPPDETRNYARDVEEATRALNANLWDAQRGVYVPKPILEGMPSGAPDTLAGLLPLIAGPDVAAPRRAPCS